MVESDGPRAEAFARALEPLGLTVVSLREGERALDRARAQRPDAVVTASALSDMSGFSLVNRLRRLPNLSEVPILLVPGSGDGDAIEAHRSGRTPATDYLPAGAPPEDLVRRVQAMLALGLSADVESEDDLDPLEPETLHDELPDEAAKDQPLPPASPAPGLAPRGASPPPLPGAPPPLSPRRQPRPDPFAELPPEPRLPMGASPDDKVTFFRERLKAREDLLARVREAHQLVRDDLQGAERDLTVARKDLEDRQRLRESIDQQLAQARAEQARTQIALDAALVDLSRGAHETATLRQDAEERAQSLSQLLNATLREREEESKRWSQKYADSERKVGLLQEEVDYLAGQLEEKTSALTAALQAGEALQGALAQARQGSQEEAAALSEQFARLQADKDALTADLGAQQASVAVKEADLSAEMARAEAIAAELAEAVSALTTARQEWTGEREALEEHIRDLDSQREALEQRVGEAETSQAELRGELEAVHELQAEMAGHEGRAVELESILSSKEAETDELRAELGRAHEERESLQDELAGQLANLAGQLQAKDRELQKAIAALTGQTDQANEARQVTEAALGQSEALREELRGLAARSQATEAEKWDAEVRLREFEAQVKEAALRTQDAQGQLRELEAQVQAAQLEAQEARLSSQDTSGRAAAVEEALQEAEQRTQQLELEAQLSNARAEAAEAARQKAEAQAVAARAEAEQADRVRDQAVSRLTEVIKSPPPSAVSPAPVAGGAGEKALRVRVSDLMTENQALKAKLQQQGAQGADGGALERLREELEAAKAENEFLTGQLERREAEGAEPETSLDELTLPGTVVPVRRGGRL